MTVRNQKRSSSNNQTASFFFGQNESKMTSVDGKMKEENNG
ncbi:hypothetical protein IGI71_000194 [Enterococcus sp. DIV1279b]